MFLEVFVYRDQTLIWLETLLGCCWQLTGGLAVVSTRQGKDTSFRWQEEEKEMHCRNETSSEMLMEN